jgi:DNA invertase Pin-like site-specific DNA recombinase
MRGSRQTGRPCASQDAQLHSAGCAKVYSEKASGARTDRPELAKLLRPDSDIITLRHVTYLKGEPMLG